jgi:hypothetical protein
MLLQASYVYWQYELQGTGSSFEKYFGYFHDYDLYKDMKATNWQDEIFGRTGTSLYNNLSVSGGTKVAKYNISLTRNDEKEIMIGSGYDRTNLTVKTSYEAKKWLKLELNSRISDYNLDGAGTGLDNTGGGSTVMDNRMTHIIQFRPINGLSDFVDSEFVDASDYEVSNATVVNPLEQIQDDYRRLHQWMVNINTAAEFTLTKDLKYRFEYGSQVTNSNNQRFFGIHTSNVIKVVWLFFLLGNNCALPV